jgi:hypothetical protein
MYAQSASLTGASAGTLAAVGYNNIAAALGAITLVFAAVSVRQLTRRSSVVRP